MEAEERMNKGVSTRRVSAADALALWEEYRESDDPRLRDRLVMTFAPMVKYIVFKKIREVPPHCEVEDFISCGLEALIASIDRYDPTRGATIEQYAWTRIHGAVLDELRRQDWAPRSLRRWQRDIAAARDRFMRLNHRPPSTEEIADSLGVTPGELRDREHEIAVADLTSLNTVVPSEEGTLVERIDTLQSQSEEGDPEAAMGASELKERFREAFKALPAREREVAVLLYLKNLRLREVGEILGVSESRVCQIHTQLKKTLREALPEESPQFSEVA
jgi:RNA polymerase sigma factor for flagellar operon FliA